MIPHASFMARIDSERISSSSAKPRAWNMRRSDGSTSSNSKPWPVSRACSSEARAMMLGKVVICGLPSPLAPARPSAGWRPAVYADNAVASRSLRRWREKQHPKEMGVVGFKHHDRHKYQHHHRWSQDGVGQGQTFPRHVHEDGDDQAGLQHHEQHDQGPPQIAMDTKIVDQIGAGAEDEQPSPDHEIELDRMLLTLCVRCGCGCVTHMSLQRML